MTDTTHNPADVVEAARAICQSGKFETGQGGCAAICMSMLGSSRGGPHGCSHATQVHGELAAKVVNALTSPKEPTDEPQAVTKLRNVRNAEFGEQRMFTLDDGREIVAYIDSLTRKCPNPRCESFGCAKHDAEPIDDVVVRVREELSVAEHHAAKWRKEAARHTRKDGWRSDYEQRDLARAAICQAIADDARAALQASQASQAQGEVEQTNLDAYDAGLLNDYGGGNVGWWQDYLRAELERAHEFYQSQVAHRTNGKEAS